MIRSQYQRIYLMGKLDTVFSLHPKSLVMSIDDNFIHQRMDDFLDMMELKELLSLGHICIMLN